MSRRRFGSVRKLPSGRWQARYRTSDGRLHTAPQTFASKTEATRFLTQAEADLTRGRWSDPRLGRTPFVEWAARWQATTVNLRPNTRAAYTNLLTAAGDAQLSVGTGGQLLVILDQPVRHPSARTHLYRTATPTGWYAMAAIQSAGLTLERAWRMLGVAWPEAYALATHTAPGAGGLTFVPHLSGERTPYFDAGIRGGWVGLGLHHERRHLVRAAFEGVAFALRQALDALRDAGYRPAVLTLAGGGSVEPMWRQLLADILGLPLVPSDRPDTSARGAALLAAQAAGLPTPDPQPPRGAATEPQDAAVAAYAEAYHRFRARSPLR